MPREVRIGAEEGVERAGHIADGFVSDLRKTLESLEEAALLAENGGDYRDDTDEHDDTLDKVVDSGSHVAARDNVDAREHRHRDDTPDVGDSERHLKQS